MGAGNQDTDCTMAIMPVIVKLANSTVTVQMYAFLDPGSSATFYTAELTRRIGGNGRKVQLTLDTMRKTHKMTSTIIQGMEVYSLNNDIRVQIHRVYTKDKMPVSHAHNPTQEDIAV